MATNNTTVSCSKDFFAGLLKTELATVNNFHPRIFACVFALYLIFLNDFAKEILDIVFSYI